jgi:adenine-specific DNA-methyltransferase
VTKTLNLSEREKEQLKALIDAGQPLPPRYRAVLFADPPEAELIWPGKTNEVTNVVLPFQTIEQIDEPRAEIGHHVTDLFDFDAKTGRQSGGWTNKLMLAALNNGPLRRQIDHAGGLKLVYIDPPFDVGANFSYDVEVGDQALVKEPSVIEELAYRDTWGRGRDSFISMTYERLILIHSLMANDGSIYVHCGHQVAPFVRAILDEIFGKSRYLNEIVWKRTSAHSSADRYGPIHDVILFYFKSENYTWNKIYGPYEQDYVDLFLIRRIQTGGAGKDLT